MQCWHEGLGTREPVVVVYAFPPIPTHRIKKNHKIMITPTEHAILLFASSLLPEQLRIEKFLSAAFCISELHGITTVFLELWNSF